MKKEPYIMIEKSIVENANLTPTAKLIYALILDRFSLSTKNTDTFSDKKGYLFCYLTYDDLILWLGISRTTIWRELKTLKKANLILVKRQGQQMPNMIYPLKKGEKVTFQNETSRRFKMKHPDVSNVNTNELDLSNPEGTKKKKRAKKTSPFLLRSRSDIIDLIIKIINDEDLTNLKSNAKDQAVNYYANRQLNEWKIGRKTIMNDDDLKLDLIGWNHKEPQFKDRGDISDKSKEKKKGEPEWMDDVMDDLAKMEG